MEKKTVTKPAMKIPAAAGKQATSTEAEDQKEINKLFRSMEKFGASDLHLKVGAPPSLRIAGSMRLTELPALSSEKLYKMVMEILTPQQKEELEGHGDLDFAHVLSDGRRFRVNLFFERGHIAMAARRINTSIPKFDELYLPVKAMERISNFEQGLVLLAGVTGSGKSTTIASIIDRINEKHRYHIITVEDPIEYAFHDKKSIINQREIGIDVESFDRAIKYLMRQDPDIIVVGEMRDRDTFDFALTAAETGHLVFGTLHASTVAQCFGRILDLFPPERHQQIRSGLHFNLKSIVCQKLLPSIKKGVPRLPAVEVMISNPIVRKLIKDGEEGKVADVVRGAKEEGMQDFTQSLAELVQKEYVTEKVALEYAPNPEQLRMALQGISLGETRGIVG